MSNMFGIQADNADGIVRVSGRGIWTPEQVEHFFIEQDGVLKGARRKTGMVHVLVDLREAPVQPQDTAAALGLWTSRVYKPVDRVASLVSTTLVVMQIRTRVNLYQFATFREPDEAIDWLLSDQQDRDHRPIVRQA
jgi:hypothetical protein